MLNSDWRADGQYTLLSDGRTHWRREGPKDGVPIVLVHGATVPSWEFDALVPRLLGAGFQTLRFDLYAHGASDRPRGPYNLKRFTRQVVEMVEASRFPLPAIFLGHSFGAALVSAVAAERPFWFSRLVLVAPMLDFSSGTRWAKLFVYPGVGEIAMSLIGIPALIRRRRLRYERIGMPHLTARFVEQVRYAGFARGLLSMFRSGTLGDRSAQYAALPASIRNILIITGEQDAIIPPQHVERVRSLLPTHRHVSLPAEHNLLLTHPEDVVRVLSSG